MCGQGAKGLQPIAGRVHFHGLVAKPTAKCKEKNEGREGGREEEEEEEGEEGEERQTIFCFFLSLSLFLSLVPPCGASRN